MSCRWSHVADDRGHPWRHHDTLRVLRSGGQNSNTATKTPLGDAEQPRRGGGLFDCEGAAALLASPETIFLNLRYVGGACTRTQ